MAQLTLYLADADVPRVVSAFEARFGPKPVEDTNGEFIKRHMQAQINSYCRNSVKSAAADAAGASYVDLDWTEPV